MNGQPTGYTPGLAQAGGLQHPGTRTAQQQPVTPSVPQEPGTYQSVLPPRPATGEQQQENAQPMMSGRLNIRLHFRCTQEQPETKIGEFTFPTPINLALNTFVDAVENFFDQQSEMQKTFEEANVICLMNYTRQNSQFNYNMPIGQYFANNDICVAFIEVTKKISNQEREEEDKIPVTVITGFLGSGKTTLLNRILKEKHGKRILVIQNEFGAIELDGTLVAGAVAQKEDITVLDNGCMCCTVRGDLSKTFAALIVKTQQGHKVDSVMIETTGLANPAPIIQTFFQTPHVQNHLKLDGVLTVVDAKNAAVHIDEIPPEMGKVNECVEQISFADRILLNKMDLVTSEQMMDLRKKIRSINQFARIHPTTQCGIKLEKILEIGAFSLDKLLEKETDFLKVESEYEEVSCDDSDCEEDHCDDKDCGHDHGHGDGEKKGHGHGHKEKAHDHGHKEKKGHGHGHGDGEKKGHGHGHKEKGHDHGHKEKGHDHGHGDGEKKGHGHGHKDGEKKGHGHGHEKKGDGKGHGHGHGKKKKHKHKRKVKRTQELQHSSGVSSIGLVRAGVVVWTQFQGFLSDTIVNYGKDIYRCKGIINTGSPKKIVFHGVHELLDSSEAPWLENEKRVSKVVFIGKNLPKKELTEGFEACIVTQEVFDALPAHMKDKDWVGKQSGSPQDEDMDEAPQGSPKRGLEEAEVGGGIDAKKVRMEKE